MIEEDLLAERAPDRLRQELASYTLTAWIRSMS
jgi:hypothetical protein